MPRPIVPPEINQPDRRAPLIVGRDPGSDESRHGRPFIGASGRLLFGGYDNLTGNQIHGVVSSAGWTREDVNITNRVLRQPWNNDFFRHSWEDIEDGKRALMELIEELNPTCIIATGAQAAYDLVPNWATLTDKSPGDWSGGKSIKSAKDIIDRRGFFWYPGEHDLPFDGPVIPTLHPASCLYQPMPNRMLLELDFQRAGAEQRGELPRTPWPEYKRIHTPADLSPLWESELVAYDVEIKYDGSFLCIAFYSAEGHALLAYADALGACVPFLESEVPKLCHNGQFDRYYLSAKYDIRPAGRHEDTIVGHWSCYPELAGKKETGQETMRKSNQMTRKGLLFLNSMHLNVGWHKTYTSDARQMGELCVYDCASTMWNWEIINRELDELGVRRQYIRQMRKLPALIAVQERGMLIDEEMRRSRILALRSRKQKLAKRAGEAALAFLKKHSLKHKEDGSEYWWYHAAQCSCCGGGSNKRTHCDRCAGVSGTGTNGNITKPDLILALWRAGHDRAKLKQLKRAELVELLPQCVECGGEGKVDAWDLNIMSGIQLKEIIWNFLDAPKYLYRGSPDAQEDTMKRVLEWAEDR